MNLLDQLLEFYFKYDKFQDTYLSQERASQIYQILLDRDRISYCLDQSGDLVGYGESWRINYDNFGRLICGHNLYKTLEQEDIEHGNIAYVSNVTIHPDHRGSGIIQFLKLDFFKKNYMCDYFVGQALRKKHQPVKVFARQQFYDKFIKTTVPKKKVIGYPMEV